MSGDPRSGGGLLIVTAVPAEAAAVRAGLAAGTAPSDGPGATVVAVGVGPAAAAAGTARLLARAQAAGTPYRMVLSAGVAGGFADRVDVGGLVIATRCVAADLGAETPEGFLPVDALGMPSEQLGGGSAVATDPALLAALTAALPGAVTGAVLTVSTVTGTARTAGLLRARHPDAVAEAMEGYGVAVAAAQAGLPVAEMRAISNPVGPRDRAAWRLADALTALTNAAARTEAAAIRQTASTARRATAAPSRTFGAAGGPSGTMDVPSGTGDIKAGRSARARPAQ